VAAAAHPEVRIALFCYFHSHRLRSIPIAIKAHCQLHFRISYPSLLPIEINEAVPYFIMERAVRGVKEIPERACDAPFSNLPPPGTAPRPPSAVLATSRIRSRAD
jgi:hypothetical protein